MKLAGLITFFNTYFLQAVILTGLHLPLPPPSLSLSLLLPFKKKLHVM